MAKKKIKENKHDIQETSTRSQLTEKDYRDMAYEFQSLKHAIKGTGYFSKPSGF